jgi:hypothetical protein
LVDGKGCVTIKIVNSTGDPQPGLEVSGGEGPDYQCIIGFPSTNNKGISQDCGKYTGPNKDYIVEIFSGTSCMGQTSFGTDSFGTAFRTVVVPQTPSPCSICV